MTRGWVDKKNIGTAARQAYQGLTFGMMDEMIDAPTAAIVAALTKQKIGDVYKDARQISKKNIAEDWKEAPLVSFGANVAGSIPFALSKPMQALSNWSRGNSMLGAVGKGAAAGAGLGAVAGAGSATPDPDGSLVDALMARGTGAGWGAAIGAPLGAAGSALSRHLSPPDDTNFPKVGKTLAKDETTKAQKMLAEALGQRPDLQDQLARAEAMDLASKNTGIQLTLAEKIAQSQSDPLLAQQKILGGNPQTAGAMEALYAGRSGTPNQAGSIENALSSQAQKLAPGVGSYDDAAGKLIEVAQGKQAGITRKLVEQAKPLYDEAYQATIDPKSPVLKNPLIQAALQRARGNPAYASSMESVAEGGTVRLKDNSIQVLDAVKRQLDDMAQTAQQSGSRNEARLIDMAKNELLSVMDEAAPTYKQARAVYSGQPDLLQMRQQIGNVADIDPMNAKQVGQKLFSGTQQNAEMAAQTLGPEGSKLAAASRIYDVMDTARGDPTSFAGKIAPDARTTDMLRTYAGGNQLDETLNVINQAKIGEKFRYGSPTQPLQQANASMEKAAGGAIDLAVGNKVGLVRKIAGLFGKGEDPQFHQDLMRLMTTDEGMDLVRKVASGQGTAIQKQQSLNALVQSIQQPANAIGSGIRNSATIGLMAPSPVFQPQSPQAQGLPPGFVLEPQSSLPPGFILERRQ